MESYDWLTPTSWLLIAGAAYLMMQQYPRPVEVVHHSPSAENQVNPTRWRHDGSQPTSYMGYGHGNRAPIIDLAMRDTLHNFSLTGAFT